MKWSILLVAICAGLLLAVLAYRKQSQAIFPIDYSNKKPSPEWYGKKQ